MIGVLLIPAFIAFIITLSVIHISGSLYLGVVAQVACLVFGWILFDKITIKPLKHR